MGTRKSRRSFLKTASAAGVVALAGCAGNGDGDDGDGGSTDGGSGEPIQVGGVMPFDHSNGQSIRRGLEFAISERNANGGLLGREVDILSRDSQLETQSAIDETRRLLDQDNVDLLAGGYVSENTLAMQNQAAGSDIIYLNTGSASPRMALRVKEDYDRYKNFFKSNLSSPLYADTVRDFYRDVVQPAYDVSSVVIMAEDLTYTEPFAPRLEEIMPEIGIEIEREIRFPTDTSDFSPHYSTAVDTGADAIVPIQSVTGPTPIVQWWDQQIELPQFGILGQARDDGFYDEVSGKVLSGTANLQGAAAEITDSTMDFVSSFNDEFGHDPVGVAYTSYDGLMSLFTAVENVGSVDDTEALISEMEQISYTGVSGVMDYQGPDGEYPHDPNYGIEDGLSHTYIQWQENDEGEGVRSILFPDAWADSDGEQDLILPPWMQ